MYEHKSTTTPSDDDAELLARAGYYRLIARLFTDPLQSRFADFSDLRVGDAAARFLGDERAGELIVAVGRELPVGPEAARRLYTTTFGLLVSPEAPPYEVEYEERTDVFWRGDRVADIAAFHRAFDLRLSGRERPDHVSVAADFLWYLLERTVAGRRLQHPAADLALLTGAFRIYLEQHFVCWIPSFASALRETARSRECLFYVAAADLLTHVCRTDAARFGFVQAKLRRPVVTDASPADECEGCGVDKAAGS